MLALAQNQNLLTTFMGFNINYFNISGYISVLGQLIEQMYGLVWVGNYQYSDFDKLPYNRYVLKGNVPSNYIGIEHEPGNILVPSEKYLK